MGASTNLKCAKSGAGLESGMEHIILLVKYQAQQQMCEKFIEEVTYDRQIGKRKIKQGK
jgi:hypothetical protein